MTAHDELAAPGLAFPRYFRVAGYGINSYKVFLCIGLYVAILTSAAAAERTGLSALRVGIGCLLCAIVGMIGARLYHLVVYARFYRRVGLRAHAWDAERGGWSVFGGLLIVPFSFVLAPIIGIPTAVFWDHLAIGIVVGGMCIRFGCVCNGCCVGRESAGWLGLLQHDTEGVFKRRIPVQWLEIAWWGLAGIGLLWLWPRQFPAGTYGFGVLAWYGAGRFWLEPLRERPDLVYGRVRLDQVVAALLALVAGGGLLARLQ
jgi:prolipoprotein diacylglyceryltransferase